MKPVRSAHAGFSLIELLVVIAIIAILAAIIFPVFGSVREKNRQASCMEHMHDIGVALKMYDADNNHYPVSLWGFAVPSTNPVQYYTGGLYAVDPKSLYQVNGLPVLNNQKYLKDQTLFVCPDNSSHNTTPITVVYPSEPGVQAGTANISSFAAHYMIPATPSPNTPIMLPANDSYDLGPQVTASGQEVLNNGQPVMELHYSLDWTGGSGPGDSPNQLKYHNPPETGTVVTWCTYHVAIAHANVVLVLMLDGQVKAVPVNTFVQKGPLGFNL